MGNASLKGKWGFMAEKIEITGKILALASLNYDIVTDTGGDDNQTWYLVQDEASGKKYRE
jgi:hypothetical protein